MRLPPWLCGAAVASFAPVASAALLVDDFEAGSAGNRLGGAYQTFTDGYSSITPIGTAPGHDSTTAGTFSYTLTAGAWLGVGVLTSLSPAWSATDVSQYAGLRFWITGTGCTLRVSVATSATQAESNHYQFPVEVSTEWRQVEVPFALLSQGWGTAQPWDPQHALSIQWTVAGLAGESGQVMIDDVELYAAAEAVTQYEPNPILPEPKINQVGYLPDAPKIFLMSDTVAAPGAAFEVRTLEGQPVLTGQLSTAAIDDTAATGERVLSGDFSAVTAPGSYRVVVGEHTSPPFRISADVYDALFRDAARAFYLIRSGVAIDDPETGIAHAASHVGDANLRSQPDVHRDLVGGWYNAQDFGKWTHMESISAAYLMLLVELGRTGAVAVPLGIPESGDAVPDLLDQARWALDWLLKMQNEDGSVLHKVDSEPTLPFGVPPEADGAQRLAGPPTAEDAGVFVGVMLQASRVFATTDAAFATRCKDAAHRAWAWLRQNPDATYLDPYYDPWWAPGNWQEKLWALAEMVRDSGDPALSEELATELSTRPLEEVTWWAPHLFGYVSLAQASDVDPALCETARSALLALADSLAARANANGYAAVIGSSEYSMGVLEHRLLARADALLFAHALSGNDTYRQAALRQLDFMLGANSLGRSFVTGHGTRSPTQPWHWTYAALGRLLPGWAVGGPNATPGGADDWLRVVQLQGTPPAKCYVDRCDPLGSYGSGEGQTTENAALAFLAGYFAAGVTTPAAPDGGVDAGTEAAARAPKPKGCGCCLVGTGAASTSALVALLVLGLRALRRRGG